MSVHSLYCANSVCGATFELHAPAADYPQQFCTYCGGPLEEYADGSSALAEPGRVEQLHLDVVSAPSAARRLTAVLNSATVTTAELDARIADACLEGIPTRVLSSQHHCAALVNWRDLKRLVSAHPMRVQVERQLDPDGWVLVVNELGITAHGWLFEDAMRQLAVDASERARQVLGMSDALPASRDMALRIWVAEAEGALEPLLRDAVEAAQ